MCYAWYAVYKHRLIIIYISYGDYTNITENKGGGHTYPAVTLTPPDPNTRDLYRGGHIYKNV